MVSLGLTIIFMSLYFQLINKTLKQLISSGSLTPGHNTWIYLLELASHRSAADDRFASMFTILYEECLVLIHFVLTDFQYIFKSIFSC